MEKPRHAEIRASNCRKLCVGFRGALLWGCLSPGLSYFEDIRSGSPLVMETTIAVKCLVLVQAGECPDPLKPKALLMKAPCVVRSASMRMMRGGVVFQDGVWGLGYVVERDSC